MMVLRAPWTESLREPLTIGVGISLLLHAVVLLARFTPPEPIRFLPHDARLEVVLLNAKTARSPEKADVLAQVNMEAGGEHEQGRARSPLKADREAADGQHLLGPARTLTFSSET